MKLISMRRLRARLSLVQGKVKLAFTLFSCVIFFFLVDHLFGIVAIILEKDFESDFSYPLDVDNFPALVENFRNGEAVEYEPINRLYSTPKFLEKADSSCDNFQLMIIMVKSAPSNIERRNVIRSTWGNPQYLRNISNQIRAKKLVTQRNSNRLPPSKNHHIEPNAFFKLVFLIGLIPDDNDNGDINEEITSFGEHKNGEELGGAAQENEKDKRSKHEAKAMLEEAIKNESDKHKDIVRIETLDSYVNNTFKTMMGIRWATEICTDFEYAFLVDDDMYISIKNLLLFLESPATYPDGETEDVESEGVGQIVDANRLYAGKVLFTKPIRQRIGSYSKWYLSLDEYEFNYFPRYMPAAAIVMSKQVVDDFYYASFYTKHFRFDDIYLGLMAYKMNIVPFSCGYFHVCHTEDGKCPGLSSTYLGARAKSRNLFESSPTYDEDEESSEDLTVVEQMEHVIARHGLTPEKLLDLWRELSLAGRV